MQRKCPADQAGQKTYPAEILPTVLNKNSIQKKKKQRIEDTIERYRKFASLYPNSKFLKMLKNIEIEMIKELQLLNTI